MTYIRDEQQYPAEAGELAKAKSDLRHNINTVAGCAFLMLSLVYFDDGVRALLAVSDTFITTIMQLLGVSDAQTVFENFVMSQIFSDVLSVFSQLLMLLLPAVIAAKNVRRRPASFYPLKAKLPEKPWSFIGLTFGLCYSVNMICVILFQRFYPNIQALSVENTLVTFLSVVIIAPIFEELVFRGVFFQSLLPFSRPFAIIFTAVIFGLMHRNPPSIINAAVFGLLAAIGFAKTGSILICVVIHMMNNATSFAATYFLQNASTYAIAILFGLFVFAMIGFAAALLINTFVSGRRHIVSLPAEISDVPRIGGRYIASCVLKSVWTWLFAALLAYSVALLYIA